MSAIAHPLATIEIPSLAALRHTARHRALRLRPSEDGWSLVSADGTLLHRGLGAASRRECLARARELGALTVFC